MTPFTKSNAESSSRPDTHVRNSNRPQSIGPARSSQPRSTSLEAAARGAVNGVLERLEVRQLLSDSTIQDLPFRLDFDASRPSSVLDQDNQGTGFTRVQHNQNGTQYDPSRIDLDTNTGVLRLTSIGSSTHGGNGGTDNSLVNGLETQFNGQQSGFTIETRLVGPLDFLSDTFEQAGLMFGPDQDNFLKLVAIRGVDGQRIEFSDEYSNGSGGLYATRHGSASQMNVGSFASIQSLDLRIVGDAFSGVVEAYYRVNGSGDDAFTRFAHDITVPLEKRDAFFNAASRAGILTYHKNDGPPITATFDHFAVTGPINFASSTPAVSVNRSQLFFTDISSSQSGGSGTSLAQTLTIANNGSTNLTLTNASFAFSSGNFRLASPISGTVTVEPGRTYSTLIVFESSSLDQITTGNLNINTGAGNPSLNVELRGLGTRGSEGNLEPSLARLLQLFNIPINVGDPDAATTDIPSPLPAGTDEITLGALRKAGSGPVTIELLANFAGKVGNTSTRFGYYRPGTIQDRTQLFAVNDTNAQTASPDFSGSLSFDPGLAAFGLYGEFPVFSNRIVASEAALNTWETNSSRRQKMRFFPLKNPDGSNVPNAYVFALEEWTVSFDQNDIVGIIRNVTPQAAAAELGWQNLDGVPFHDRLVFSRITNLAIEDPNTGQIPNTVKDTSVLRLLNTGTQNLSITGLSISNGDFVIDSIRAVGSTTNLSAPFTIAPGAAVDVTLRFVYTRSGTGNEQRNATLTIQSSDADEPTRTFTLAGLWQSHSENAQGVGSVEATLLRIIQTLGYNINVGTNFLVSDNQVTKSGNRATSPSWVTTVNRTGEEVLSSNWLRADNSRPVGVRMLAAYHQQKTQAASQVRWVNPSATSGGSFLFRHKPSDGQTMLPVLDNNSPAFAEFNPTSAFQLRVDSHWSDASKNQFSVAPAAFPFIDGGHAMRWYPARDASGNLIPNTYIVAQDYTGQSFSNYDYQDNIYLVTNVRPESGPTAVTNPSATAQADSIRLNWQANTEGNLAGYRVYRSTTSNGTYAELTTNPVTGTSFSDASALVNVTYFYRVIAVDYHGTLGATGSTVSATRSVDTTPPATPNGLTGSGSLSGISLDWSDNADSDLAGYRVYRASSVNGTYTLLTSTLLTASAFVDANAPAGATSFYRVTAVDSSGNESNFASVSASRPANPNPPAAPSSLSAVSNTPGRVDLTWTDNASNEVSFQLERRTGSGNFTLIATLGANTTNYTDNSADEGATYTYRIRAVNTDGNSNYSNESTVNVPVTPTTAPSNLASLVLGPTSVRLTWTDNATNESGFRIERRTGSGAWSQIASVGANVTLFVDATAAASTTYSYRVRAFSGAGETSPTNEVTLTTPVADSYVSTDIGNPTPPGSTNVVNSGRDYDITAGGVDVWNSADQLRFVHRSITGDFDYSVRITNITAADSGSMAGLMARASTAAGSQHAFIRARAANTMRFNYRSATNGSSTGVGSLTANFPNQWVRLTRVGNTFTGFGSIDGTNWTVVGSITIAMPATIQLGMAVSARVSNGSTTTAQFRDLTDRSGINTPAPATLLTGQADALPRVVLNWQDNSNNETGFRIERRVGSGAWSNIGSVASGATQFIDTTVSLGVTYDYRVIAFNTQGDAPASNIASVGVTSGIPTAPSNLSVAQLGRSARLQWNDNSNNELGFQVERRLSSSSTFVTIATLPANANGHTDSDISTGVTYIYRVKAIGSSADSSYSNEVSFASPTTASYSSSDIGSPAAGSTTVVTPSRDFDINAAGSDVWSRSDQFRFVYQQVTGDFDIRVRVESLSAANANAMAGLMARETLSADSRNIYMKVRANTSLRTTYRATTAGNTVGAGSGNTSFPNAWLRLVRSGNNFTTFVSPNGTNWTVHSTVTLALNSTLLIGMAVASYSPTATTTTPVRFRDLEIL